MTAQAVIIGIVATTYIMFDLWHKTREDHPNLSLLFFGVGMAGINALTFISGEIMRNTADLAYLSPYSNVLFMIVMWTSIIASAYVLFNTIWTFVKLTYDWVLEKMGLGGVKA